MLAASCAVVQDILHTSRHYSAVLGSLNVLVILTTDEICQLSSAHVLHEVALTEVLLLCREDILEAVERFKKAYGN